MAVETRPSAGWATCAFAGEGGDRDLRTTIWSAAACISFAVPYPGKMAWFPPMSLFKPEVRADDTFCLITHCFCRRAL